MNLLAIDTTLSACSAAIYCSGESGDARIHHEYRLMDRGHAENLMPMIERLGHQAELELTSLDRIAVTTGPGTFTGVRIGIAAARGLGLATGCKIFHETSLRIIALKAMKSIGDQLRGRHMAVAMDARRGEIYLQIFGPSREALMDAVALSPVDAVAVIERGEKKAVIIGSGMDILAEVGLGAGHILASELKTIQPCAVELAELAATAHEHSLADHVSPLYLRAPDAKPQIGKSIPRAN